MRETHAQRGGRRFRCTCPTEQVRMGRGLGLPDLVVRTDIVGRDEDCPVHGDCAVQGHLDGGDGCYCGAR